MYIYTLFKIFCINIHFYPFYAKCPKTDRKTTNILCNIYLTNIKKTIDKPLVMCYTNYAEGHGETPNKINKNAQGRKRENIMTFSSIRPTTYTAQMTIEKGIIYLTDTLTGKVKHHININEGAIYTHARKTPTAMVSGICFSPYRLFYNDENLIEDFVARFLTCNNKNYYNNLFANFSFVESALKVYGDKIEKYLFNILRSWCTQAFTTEIQTYILKNKKYMEWCFNNNYDPFYSYRQYVSEKVIKELCGDNEELFEGIKNQQVFVISPENPNAWKDLQFAIKVIQDSPSVIYAHTNEKLVVSYNSICNKVDYYLKICDKIKREPTTKDFMNEYYRTQYIYYNWKYNHEKEIFLSRYSDILKFEYGNLEVILPTDPADLTKEGNDNHNCVGGYIKYVTDGSCIVVFIRHKDSPNKSYITCEILPNSRINQFYLQWNRNVQEIEDITFYELYQKYLYEHADEIKALCKKF